MKKEHLFSITKKDLEIEFFSGKGAGGQHRNKHQNCVRMRHKDSGIVTTGQSHRERQSNIKEAFSSLTKHPKFKIWMNRKVHEAIEGKTIEDRVNEQMSPKNLKVEVRGRNGWTEFKGQECR